MAAQQLTRRPVPSCPWCGGSGRRADLGVACNHLVHRSAADATAEQRTRAILAAAATAGSSIDDTAAQITALWAPLVRTLLTHVEVEAPHVNVIAAARAALGDAEPLDLRCGHPRCFFTTDVVYDAAAHAYALGPAHHTTGH